MTQTPTALVIGATGSFGAHATMALIKHGWSVRALARDPQGAARRFGERTPVDWRRGDAMDPASIVAAAEGVQALVHAANPPGYRNWGGLVAPMVEGAIAGAMAAGARLVLPGTVYNYAPDAGPTITEDAPQAPTTRKGRIREAVERRLLQASADGLKVLILRAGDFFGPATPNGSFHWLVRVRGGRVGGVWAPGPQSVGHAFAYTPDLGETLARLLARESELAAFERFHFRGHWLPNGGDLARAIGRVSGQPGLRARPFPWIAVDLAAPFNETLRELREMRYLWRRPIGLDNERLVRFLGSEPHTPLDEAVATSLADMGLLAESASPSAAEVERPPSCYGPSAIAAR